MAEAGNVFEPFPLFLDHAEFRARPPVDLEHGFPAHGAELVVEGHERHKEQAGKKSHKGDGREGEQLGPRVQAEVAQTLHCQAEEYAGHSSISPSSRSARRARMAPGQLA